MLVSVFSFVEIKPVAIVERHDLPPTLNLACLHLAGLLVHWQHVWVNRLAATERKCAQERFEALAALRRCTLAIVVRLGDVLAIGVSNRAGRPVAIAIEADLQQDR